MYITNLYLEIVEFCKNHADPAIVKKYAHYFTEGYDAYGVDTNTLKEKFKEWHKTYKEQLDMDNVYSLADLLFKNGKNETSLVAILFLNSYKKQFHREQLPHLKHFLDHYITNWAHTDGLCGEIIWQYLVNDTPITDLKSWRKSPSKWTRRAVPVSLIKVMKKKGMATEIIELIDPLIRDTEKPVHQGLGWLLREMWKKYPAETEVYLLKIKDNAPRLIIQYATEKMDAEGKAKFKKATEKKGDI